MRVRLTIGVSTLTLRVIKAGWIDSRFRGSHVPICVQHNTTIMGAYRWYSHLAYASKEAPVAMVTTLTGGFDFLRAPSC